MFAVTSQLLLTQHLPLHAPSEMEQGNTCLTYLLRNPTSDTRLWDEAPCGIFSDTDHSATSCKVVTSSGTSRLAILLRIHPGSTRSTNTLRPMSQTRQVSIQVAVDSPSCLSGVPCPFRYLRIPPLTLPSQASDFRLDFVRHLSHRLLFLPMPVDTSLESARLLSFSSCLGNSNNFGARAGLSSTLSSTESSGHVTRHPAEKLVCVPRSSVGTTWASNQKRRRPSACTSPRIAQEARATVEPSQ